MNGPIEPTTFSRRRILQGLPAFVAALMLAPPRWILAQSAPVRGRVGGPPDPRPGIDASNVLTAEDLADVPDVIPIFDAVREIPHIVDGLRCYCGCADAPGYRSLLSCFESYGMAIACDDCLGQARLAHRRWQEGQSLDQIRRAIDARFAPPTGI